MSVLTLLLARDCLDRDNYHTLLSQGIEQKIVIVSAIPIVGNIENYVVPPPQDISHSERIAYSINKTLFKYPLDDYDYLFKVDGDIKLPRGYLEHLILRGRPVDGCGQAMLLEKKFFLSIFGGRWPQVYADDSYIWFKAFAKGCISSPTPPIRLVNTTIRNRKRSFLGGQENYRYGIPLQHQAYICARSRDFWRLCGYLSVMGTKRYE